MNRDDYRRAFDRLQFSADFQARTEDMLNEAVGRAAEQEEISMNTKRIRHTAVLAAAIVAALVITVSAAVYLLSPKDVAQTMDDPKLAAAFDSPDAVLMNETAVIGDYTCTVTGMVSGSQISDWNAEVEGDHTYVVAAIARTDGTPLERESWEAFTDWTLTPLVAGYPAWVVNNWTLGTGGTCMVENGIAYYLLDIQQLRIFADHTVYLAVYEGGGVPSRDMVEQTPDGPISLADGVSGAMFTLPLDASLADPAAAEQFIVDSGMKEAVELFRAGGSSEDAAPPVEAEAPQIVMPGEDDAA